MSASAPTPKLGGKRQPVRARAVTTKPEIQRTPAGQEYREYQNVRNGASEKKTKSESSAAGMRNERPTDLMPILETQPPVHVLRQLGITPQQREHDKDGGPDPNSVDAYEHEKKKVEALKKKM